MVVVNHTKISGEEMKSLLTYSAKKAIMKRYIMSLVVILFGLGIFIYSLLEKIGQISPSLVIFSALFVAIGVAYLIMSFIQSKSLPKKLYKENQMLCDFGADYTYTFKENSMRCENRSNGQLTKFDYSYTKLKKVYEYENRYELRFEEEMVAYVYKNGFSEQKMVDFFISNITINHQAQEDSKKRIRLKIRKKYKEVEEKRNEN